MPSNRPGTDEHEVATSKALAGILALLIEERQERVAGDKNATKIEVLLAGAGLSNEDIAAVANKSPDAVRKTIERAGGK